MMDNYEAYLKELHKKYESVVEHELMAHWRDNITSHLATILHLADSLKTVDAPDSAEVLDEETFSLLKIEGEKALVEIEFIVQYVQRLRQGK